MKKIQMMVFVILIATVALAQTENIQKFQPDLKSAVVYLEGVEYSHVLPVKLLAGRNMLVFEGLSSKLDPKSIRVATAPEVSVLSVSSKIDYLVNKEEKPKIRLLRDSVALVNGDLQALADEKEALGIQKDLLLKNQSIGGEQAGVNVTELQKAADFYATRVWDINKRISQINVTINEHSLILVNLTNELNELNARVSYQRAQIHVLVSAEKDLTADFDLRYYVSDAGWAPYYELKSEEIGQPIELIYRAKVVNNTDIDWNNITIILSTGDPTKSVLQPKLDPWKLNYEDDVMTGWVDNPQTYGWRSNLNDNYNIKQQEQQKHITSKGEVQYTTIEVPQLSVEFPVKSKYSIPSDSKPYIVDVTQYNLPATYKHICIPKVDKDAFLLARITGWEDLNLVEGPANIYFGGSYVGQSYIYTRNVSDTLDLSLGRDNKVLVTRTKMKEFTDKQLIGSKRKETYRYQIVVKNNHKAPINIEIQDQYPVSENTEIEVAVDEVSLAAHNILTGICKWDFTISPDKTEKVSIQYTVKYPKNKAVQTKSEKSVMRSARML